MMVRDARGTNDREFSKVSLRPDAIDFSLSSAIVHAQKKEMMLRLLT
jgi:hypothetical protein